MSTPSSPMSAPGAGFALSNRILAATLMGALVAIAMGLSFVSTDPSPLTTPPLWMPLAQVAAGVVVHLLLTAMAAQVPPLDSSLDEVTAAGLARQRWQEAMILRFVPCESIAIVSLAAGFVIDHGLFLTYLGGAAVSLVLLWLHVWPSRRTITRFAEGLESGGQRSGLREAFGFDSRGGAIQEL